VWWLWKSCYLASKPGRRQPPRQRRRPRLTGRARRRHALAQPGVPGGDGGVRGRQRADQRDGHQRQPGAQLLREPGGGEAGRAVRALPCERAVASCGAARASARCWRCARDARPSQQRADGADARRALLALQTRAAEALVRTCRTGRTPDSEVGALRDCLARALQQGLLATASVPPALHRHDRRPSPCTCHCGLRSASHAPALRLTTCGAC